MSSPHEIIVEALRIAREGNIKKALQIITPLIPPEEDYGIELSSTANISYYIDREGLLAISRRLEEGIPYMTSTARKLAWDLLPSWVAEDLEFCRVIRDLVRINREWLSREGRGHPYEAIARKVAEIDVERICG